MKGNMLSPLARSVTVCPEESRETTSASSMSLGNVTFSSCVMGLCGPGTSRRQEDFLPGYA
ncbi:MULTISPECIES: hypothetical protein [Bacteroidales]|uniref:hypothetical protein n=1 Tax=Bacteroidales TaxID=171549 RepID=UPI00201E088C|nr:hypothetical protein [Parabacteroides merdae]